jgi:hypothetical protein
MLVGRFPTVIGYIIGHTDTFADPRKVEAIQGIMPCTPGASMEQNGN